MLQEKEKRYKIVFDRKACIGAAACAAVAPEFWVMNEDGKADLKGSRLDYHENHILIVKESELTKEGRKLIDIHKEAAQVCPVQVIHIYDEETGDQII